MLIFSQEGIFQASHVVLSCQCLSFLSEAIKEQKTGILDKIQSWNLLSIKQHILAVLPYFVVFYIQAYLAL